MAKVIDNALLKGLSGTIGRQLTFRQKGGQTFVSKSRGPSTVAPTNKLINARTKFSVATAYAKKVVQTPALKSIYQAATQGGQRAFNVAIKDALNAPVVEAIMAVEYLGKIDDRIVVRATDDFKIEHVLISIHDASGELLEQGNATMQENKEEWCYAVQKMNANLIGTIVTATAIDLPGNCTTSSIIL